MCRDRWKFSYHREESLECCSGNELKKKPEGDSAHINYNVQSVLDEIGSGFTAKKVTRLARHAGRKSSRPQLVELNNVSEQMKVLSCARKLADTEDLWLIIENKHFNRKYTQTRLNPRWTDRGGTDQKEVLGIEPETS